MKKLFPILFSAFCILHSAFAVYDIPATNRINWYPAGLDVVTGSGIPTTFTATNAIAGLSTAGGAGTANATAINNAITAAASNTVLTIAAGDYPITGDINMTKSGVVLRGAKAVGEYGTTWLPTTTGLATNCTTLSMNGGKIFFNGGSPSSSWTPGSQSGYTISSGYTRASTNLVVTSGSFTAGDYIAVYQDDNSTWISPTTSDGSGGRTTASWLGEDSSPPHVFAQYKKVTGVSGSAPTITLTIDPPIYLVTPDATNPRVRKQSMGLAMAGLENMRLKGNGGNVKLIWIRTARNCWVKGVETYNVGANSSGSPHLWTEFCYANEYRKNHHHFGAGFDSGANYGIEFYHWNSRHKVEDNIIRQTRHSIVFEGGGSGNVILYNYTDDNWESVQGSPNTRDETILSEDQVANHGAHPFMNLWEGNFGINNWADYTQGSSSHNTLFRNYYKGFRTSYPQSNPWSFTMLEIEQYNRYYQIIGNILGNPTMTTGTVIDNNTGGNNPKMFRFGVSSSGGSYQDPQSRSTATLHGNYDFITDGILTWDGGADHTLNNSLYYTNQARPSWMGDRTWPPVNTASVGAAALSYTNIPAGHRYIFGTEPGAGGGDVTSPVVTITSPTSSATYDNGSATTINLGGTSSDAVGVASVTWSNDRGGSGNASGTTSWSILGIALQTGDNVITVTAADTSNNTSNDTITVSVAGAVISVISTNSYFSEIAASAAYTNVFVVTNTGGSTLSGAVTIGSGTTPWSILGNANYSLTTGNSTNITVKFNPSSMGAYTNTLVFTGGGGTTNTIAGRCFPVLSPYTNMAATNFLVEPPFSINPVDGSISQTVEVSGTPSEGGRAAFGFTLTSATNLSISVMVNAQTTGSDSFYIAIDGEPTDPTNISDVLPLTSTNFVLRVVNQRGNGTASEPQWTNYVWTNVSAGTHEVIIRGREANTLIQSLSINTITSSPTDTTNPTLSITNPTSGATYTATNSPITIGGSAADAGGLSQVVFETDRGASGTATGTTTWTGSLTLQIGTNVLTVTAIDQSSNQTNATLTIYYGPTNVYTTVIQAPFGIRPIP